MAKRKPPDDVDVGDPEGRWYSDQPRVRRWSCPDCDKIVEREDVSEHAWHAHGKAIDSSRPREAGFRPAPA
jgi:hypothetical protein